MEPVKLTRADWPHVKRHALFAVGTLLACLLVLGGSYHVHRSAEQSRQQAQAGLETARGTLANLENERAELAASLPLYQELADRAIIGTERRLDWRETLRAGQQKTAMGKVSFSLAPRRPFDADPAGGGTADGLFRRYRSTMKLGLEFRRETDFVDFLEHVAGRAHALTVIRGCRIGRQGDPGQPGAAGLAAECVVDWATLERSAPAAEGGSS